MLFYNFLESLTLSRFRYVEVIGRLRSISKLSGEGEGGNIDVGLVYMPPSAKGCGIGGGGC